MFELLSRLKSQKDFNAFVILNSDKNIEISNGKYYEDIAKCAFELKKIIGDLRGKRIGLYANSSYEYTVMLSAIMFSRGVAVPLNIHESLDNIKYCATNAELDWIIVDETREAVKDELAVDIIRTSDILSGGDDLTELEDFSDEENETSLLIIYTSGTTGKPKGVVISAESLFNYPQNFFGENFPLKEIKGLRVYDNFPLYHIGGVVIWLMRLREGCTIYTSSNPGGILTDLEKNQIDYAIVTPAGFKLLEKTLRRGHVERLGGMKVIATAGAPADFNVVDTFLANGIAYGQYYGMTESCGIITSNFDCKEHLKSIGLPDPCVNITIIDGEICVKSPGVMQGYYKDKEETDKSLIDGMLHTGDLGRIDEDGFVYITGRKKNLIILSGGENVSPEELEKKLSINEHIHECKVYAENDRIYALVYSENENEEDIRQYVKDLNKSLPIFKRIYKVNIQNEPLEKTASGKIKR